MWFSTLHTDALIGAATAGRKGGQSVVGADAASGRGVLVQVRNVPALIKAQGGRTGSFIDSLVPDTMEATVYSKMADEIAAGMKEKGVDADVKVVAASGYHSASSDYIRVVLLGALAVGAWWTGWNVLDYVFKRGK